MSKVTKRKHVTREVLEDLVEPSESQEIVRIVCGRGNNLHEVENSSREKYLVSMPTKFRRNVWIKRGDYVIVEPIAEGHKVQAEIVHILYPLQIKHLREERLWPQDFEEQMPTAHAGLYDQRTTDCKQSVDSVLRGCTDVCADNEEESESEEGDDSDLFINTNRPPPLEYESSSEEEEESDS